MSPNLTLPVQHVSDTAYMVAAYRLIESQRSDARFHDPFAAALLGGDAARYLVDQDQSAFGHWMLTVRTCMIDRWLAAEVQRGDKLIVNLAAGLDTRPYRLEGLDPGVAWLEVDFAPVIEHKQRTLAAYRPLYRLDRMAADLADPRDLRRLMTTIKDYDRDTLVLTEGLLLYLEQASVEAIASTLYATPQVQHWLSEFTTPEFLAWAVSFWQNRPAAGADDVSFRFAPSDLEGFFARQGWQLSDFRSFAEESARIGRLPPTSPTVRPADLQQQMGKVGFGLLQRGSQTHHA